MEIREVKRNAGQIARYIEHVWPKYERAGGIPEVPFDRKAKGEYNPPIGEHAIAVMDANREPAGFINPAIEEMKDQDLAYGGVSFNDVMAELRYNPGAIRNWRRGENEEEKRSAEAFWKMCLLLAQTLSIRFPGVQLEVVVNPEDETADSQRDVQKIDTMYRRRLMVEQLEAVEQETGYVGEMAMEILSERKAKEGKDWSVPKLTRARTAVNKERAKEASESSAGEADGEVA